MLSKSAIVEDFHIVRNVFPEFEIVSSLISWLLTYQDIKNIKKNSTII